MCISVSVGSKGRFPHVTCVYEHIYVMIVQSDSPRKRRPDLQTAAMDIKVVGSGTREAHTWAGLYAYRREMNKGG